LPWTFGGMGQVMRRAVLNPSWKGVSMVIKDVTGVDNAHQQPAALLLWRGMGHRNPGRPQRSSATQVPSDSRHKSLACRLWFGVYSRAMPVFTWNWWPDGLNQGFPVSHALQQTAEPMQFTLWTLRKARPVPCRYSPTSQSVSSIERIPAVHGTTVLTLEAPNTRKVALVGQTS
jgi:hypothetical protein